MFQKLGIWKASGNPKQHIILISGRIKDENNGQHQDYNSNTGDPINVVFSIRKNKQKSK